MHRTSSQETGTVNVLLFYVRVSTLARLPSFQFRFPFRGVVHVEPLEILKWEVLLTGLTVPLHSRGGHSHASRTKCMHFTSTSYIA